MKRWRMSMPRFFRRRAADADLTNEIDAHIAQEIDDNLARGMSAAILIQSRLFSGTPPQATTQALSHHPRLTPPLHTLTHIPRLTSLAPQYLHCNLGD